MITVTATPQPLNWSRNRIIYKLQTNTVLTTPGLTIEVKVMFARRDDANNYQQVLIMTLTPDSGGNVSIDLKKIFDNILYYDLPEINTIKNCVNQTGDFFLQVRETTEANPDPGWVIAGAPQAYTVIKGGIPLEQWTPQYFTNFTYQYKNYLTWKKPGILLAPEEKHFLSYLHTADDTASDSEVVFEITYTDGTTANFQLTPAAQFTKYHAYRIPVGVEANALETLQPDKKIHYYTVQPFGDSSPLADPFLYYVDYRHFYEPTTIHYFNSAGGFDAARILGDVEKTVKLTTSVANNQDEEFDYQITEKITFKTNIGYIEDPYEQDTFRDLLLSRAKYEYKHGTWRKIRIITEEISFGSKSLPIFELPFEWTYAYTNENYAPDNLNLNA